VRDRTQELEIARQDEEETNNQLQLLIERIEAQAPETAEGLQKMVEGLQMGKLGELLEEV
jgi:hypothetical protein